MSAPISSSPRLHDARHQLRVGGVFEPGAGLPDTKPIMVWCGRCKDDFVVDGEWAQRWLDAYHARVEHDKFMRPAVVTAQVAVFLQRFANRGWSVT